ncbi:MAG: YraN family protein [Spirochaetes bacterium]|nr:YraN family protein [Spirochaetota bacterium]MBN2770010.1 YraN family protein [Spirochaetota bacterium]
MDDRAEKGGRGEQLAVDYLENQGFTILTQNYRYGRYAEIDIIAQKDELLLFVEVRSQDTFQMGSALHSVRQSKIDKLRKCARSYLAFVYPQDREVDCRFDLITIDKGELTWYQDISR